MKKLILSCIVLFFFTQGMYGQINSSLFDQIETESSEVELLPPSMIFTQRLLWGEKGLLKKQLPLPNLYPKLFVSSYLIPGMKL